MCDTVYNLIRACDAMEAAGVSEDHIRAVFAGAQELGRVRGEEAARDAHIRERLLRVMRDAVTLTYG